MWTGHFSSHVIAAGYSGFYGQSKMGSIPQGQFQQMLIQLMGLVSIHDVVLRISVLRCLNYSYFKTVFLLHVRC